MTEHPAEADARTGETPSSVDKAIDLLFHLHGQTEARGVSEVSRALGVPKSSAHRLLATLARRGLLERDGRGRYRPGLGLIALGLGVQEREPVAVAARPVLEAEAQRLGETVFLTVARAGALVVLDKAEGSGLLRAAPRVGSTLPLHATAVGKLYLAFAPESVGRLGADPELFTPHTLTSREALSSQVRQARERGFAENRGEWIPGLAVVAAPVRAGQRMVGALAVAAPAQRMELLGRERVARRVMEAARTVGARLDGSAAGRGALR